MAASLNVCHFIGNLGRDPELKATPSGQSVTRFSLACTENWTKDGEKQSRTEWVNCVVWGKQAEIAEKYLRKGKQVHVTGKLQTRKYTDKDHNEKLAVEIIVSSFVMLGSAEGGEKKRDEDRGHDGGRDDGFGTSGSFPDDDIPF